MSTIVLLLITGLGLGALYFLVASGLSLIYGLMGVLNFAHGSFLTIGAFMGWEAARRLSDGSWWALLAAMITGALVGALAAAATEYFLIRRLYNRHIEQVLVTVGLGSLSGAALAPVLVAVLQPFANFYLGGTGDLAVVLALAAVLLIRPRGLLGSTT
ncbi:ABC transporter permease subunit [Cryobacterium psychrophilum]|uniref:Branched-chain amino acid ABC transporter permease n=1 Tax=Cryobacterium psychrophilum TaxID=41988 RepID=A0A4Y8KQY2_9MICO|nr:hypothetical protein [Cryobacterium psychrophilum]TFD77796.1 hypothetical protein E3T53_10865 [Cryobacterium psychrophilum]